MKLNLKNKLSTLKASLRRESKQNGQIIVLTALLLPFFMAATGLAVDFGNMYVHKSKLQNAADAAAVAAGWGYVSNTNEYVYPGDVAKSAAIDSVEHNAYGSDVDLAASFDINDKNQKEGYLLAKVTDKNVPIYFLRYFGVGDTVAISASSYVKVGADTPGADNIFNNIGDLSKVAYYEDNFTSTGGDKVEVNGVWQHDDVVKQIEQIKESLAIDLNKDVIDPDKVLKNLKPEIIKDKGAKYKYEINYSDVAYLGGDAHEPVYITLDNKAGEKKCLEIINSEKAFEARPIVLIYTGKEDLRIDVCNSDKFKGIIYAPNAKLIVKQDEKNPHDKQFFEFKGTIIAKDVDLKVGRYNHEKILEHDNKGGHRGVNLVSMPNGTKFNQI